MATLSGHRTVARAAAATAALLYAALTMGASPAQAAGTGPTVEFTGGSVLSLLVCKSEPSRTRVTVPAESRVVFVNRLGQAATLQVDGRAVANVRSNEAVPVVFHYGPVNVAMTFACGVGVVEEFKSVAVTVTAPPGAEPTGTGGASGGGYAPAPAPSVPAAGTVRPSQGVGAVGTGEASRTSTATGGSGGEQVDPTLADVTGSAGPPATAPNGTRNRDVPPPVLVEAPIPASGTPREGPGGLLALVATVCVVGVGMAAIRAIIAQRATRTGLA
jgi:hypothetical protein